jgi:hypothetical protein
VPTILIAMAMNKKRVKMSELFFGLLISLGMVLFAVADFQVYPDANAVGSFLFLFLTLVIVSLTYCHFLYLHCIVFGLTLTPIPLISPVFCQILFLCQKKEFC